MRINSIAYYSFTDTSALAVIRVLGPAGQSGIRVATGVDNGIIHLDAIDESDLVVIQRDFCREVHAYEEIVSRAHAQHKPIVLDVDDLLFELPEDHPDRIKGYYTDALFPLIFAIMEADLVTVSTEVLRDYLLPYNANIQISPNYLNDNLWRLKPPASARDDDGPLVIGFMGGNSHLPDLVMVLPALLKIHQRYPERIRFHFWGITPPDELLPYSQVDWSPYVSNDYADFVEYFQTQTADLMIAPLCDNLFNSCKSAIKFFEYAAIGVPGVFSRLRPYADVITDGEEGLLASTLDEWENALSSLIEDSQLRYQMACNAQTTLREKWLLSQNASRLIDIWSQAEAQSAGLTLSANSLVKIGRLINKQYYDESKTRLLRIKSLTDQLAEKEHFIESLTESLTAQLMEKESLIESLTGTLAERENLVASLTAQLEERENLVASLMSQLEEREKYLVSLTGQLAEKENIVISLTSRLGEEESDISSLTTRLTAQNEIIAVLTNDAEELKKELLSYVLSKSWRFTRPFRKVKKRLMRENR